MKKLMIAAVIVAGITSFTSCKKDRTCKCVTKDTSGIAPIIPDVNFEATFKANKSDAEDACDLLESSISGFTTTCELD